MCVLQQQQQQPPPLENNKKARAILVCCLFDTNKMRKLSSTSAGDTQPVKTAKHSDDTTNTLYDTIYLLLSAEPK